MDDLRLTLRPQVESVRTSRDAVRAALRSVDEDQMDVAALLTDELVANAIRYGEPPIELALTESVGVVTVSVTDCAPSVPVVRDPGPRAVSGRGMQIVEAMSDGWGVERLQGGKRVWFQLAVGGGPGQMGHGGP